MVEIYVAVCVAFMLPAALMLGVMASVEKQRHRRRAKYAAAIGLLVVFGIGFNYVRNLPPGDFGLIGWNTRDSGTAPARYFEPHVVGGENGSAIVVWTSNAYQKFSASNRESESSRVFHIARLDSAGNPIPRNRTAFLPGPDPDWGRHIRELRYQDGLLFIRGYENVSVFDPARTWRTNLTGPEWNQNKIFQLPGGPVVMPMWDMDKGVEYFGNGARNSTGSLFCFGGPQTPFCTVLDGNGTVLVNATMLDIGRGRTQLELESHLAVDRGDNVLLLTKYRDYDGSLKLDLEAYSSNLTSISSFNLDDHYRHSPKGLVEVEFDAIGPGLLGILLAEHEAFARSYPEIEGRLNLTLVTMNFNGTGFSNITMHSLPAFKKVGAADCAFGTDGRTILLVYHNDGELHLRSMDFRGNLDFKDVRLTPTDDKYSWDYPID